MQTAYSLSPLSQRLSLLMLAAVSATGLFGQTLIQTIDLTTSPVPVISIPGQTNPAPIAPGGPSVKLTSVAVNPNTNTVYVGDWATTNVYLIDGATNTVTAAVLTQDLRTTVDLGPFFPGVGGTGPNVVMVNPVDNSWAYLGIGGGARFVGTAFAEPYNNAALPLAGAWDPNTNNIYGGIGQFFVTNNLKFIGAGFPCGGTTMAVAVNAVTNRAYASCGNGSSGVFLAYDGAGFKDKRIANPALARLSGPFQPAGLAVNPNTNRIYASAMTRLDALDVIDGTTHAVVATIPGLDPPQIPNTVDLRPVVVHTGTNQIFVVNPGSSSVDVFDGNTNTRLTRITTQGGAVAAAVNEKTNMLYVANQSGTLSVYTLNAPAGAPTYSVSGLIQDNKGVPAAGVTVTVTGGGVTASAVTDTLGLYVATGLPAGVYTVTPKSATLGFTPFSRGVTIAGDNAAKTTFTSGALALFTLSVGKSNPGTVTSDLAGINCGSSCSAKYAAGTAVTLTAIPPAGKTFSKWNGACAGTDLQCTVVITRDTSVQAIFNK